MVRLSQLCSLVLYFAFKYVVHYVLFLPEEVRPMNRTKRRVTSFSLKNILCLLLYLLKFNLPLIVQEELINFKLKGLKFYQILFFRSQITITKEPFSTRKGNANDDENEINKTRGDEHTAPQLI